MSVANSALVGFTKSGLLLCVAWLTACGPLPVAEQPATFTPSATATPPPTQTLTPTPTPSGTFTPEPTMTATPKASATPVETATAAPTGEISPLAAAMISDTLRYNDVLTARLIKKASLSQDGLYSSEVSVHGNLKIEAIGISGRRIENPNITLGDGTLVTMAEQDFYLVIGEDGQPEVIAIFFPMFGTKDGKYIDFGYDFVNKSKYDINYLRAISGFYPGVMVDNLLFRTGEKQLKSKLSTLSVDGTSIKIPKITDFPGVTKTKDGLYLYTGWFDYQTPEYFAHESTQTASYLKPTPLELTPLQLP